jgi:cobalamin transport system permease protein
LGAMVMLKLGLGNVSFGVSGVAWGAFAGCGAVVSLVLLMATRRRLLTGNTLILAGMTIGLFCSAMMMFVTYLANVNETFFIVRWMMGSLDTIGHGELGQMVFPLVVSWSVLLLMARSLDQFEMGDEVAASRGVDPGRLQVVVIVFASLGTACIVSICGPIGFVGLIVPQTLRVLVGRGHRLLLPMAGLWGGSFLIVSDWLTRLAPRWFAEISGRDVAGFPLPIGVMTAVIGAPVLVLLLWRRGLR